MSNTKVKIHYDPITGKVKGNYPNRIKYNYPIPEPFIEIEEVDQDKSGKPMAVVDGIYKEYTPNTEEKKAVLKKQLIASRLLYLQKTDWFIAKEFDEPNSYPQKVKNKRILAREEINNIESCTTLTALNQFSSTFE